MIRYLKQEESDRIWLSREAAMAGRENQVDLWFLSSGLDLQLPIVCAGFRTQSLASVQSLEHRDAHLMKLALDWAWTRKWWTMCLKSGYTSSKWLNQDWGGSSAKWGVHIYAEYAEYGQWTILHIGFSVCILFCILQHINLHIMVHITLHIILHITAY